MPYLSVSQSKYNALKKENERLKEELEAEKVHSSLIFDEKNEIEAKLLKRDDELYYALDALEVHKGLLSEDLVAENAKLKLKIWEMECSLSDAQAMCEELNRYNLELQSFKVLSDAVTARDKADAIREAIQYAMAPNNQIFVPISELEEYANQLEAEK